AAAHRSRRMEISYVCAQPSASLLHYRTTVSHDALRVLAAALSAANCGSARNADADQLQNSFFRGQLCPQAFVEQHIARGQFGFDRHAVGRGDQLLRAQDAAWWAKKPRLSCLRPDCSDQCRAWFHTPE